MSWLVTAFEPFGGAGSNSSLMLMDRLKTQDWQGRVEFFSPVPVVFSEAWPVVRREIERRPHLKGVLALGQAERRSRISLERVALNWIDAHIPDNLGAQPNQCRIEDGEPEILWSGIPWEKLEPSPHWERSYSAGAYLCNSLMYNILNWCRKNDRTGGFVHVPLIQSQADPVLQKHTERMPDKVAADSLSRIINFLSDS